MPFLELATKHMIHIIVFNAETREFTTLVTKRSSL